MIEYLNHELIECNSFIHTKSPETYSSYKCIKCNNIIFRSINLKDRNAYWMYAGGKDTYNTGIPWDWLKLTCEEEMIKKLLE